MLHLWGRLRRPDGLVERTRWLFALCGIVSLVLSLVAGVQEAGSGLLPQMLLASVVLCVSWVRRYLTGRAPPAWDVVDVVAVLALASCLVAPANALRIAFPALWFRAVYNLSTSHVVVYCAGVMGALVAALPVRQALSLPFADDSLMIILGTAPVALLTTMVALNLAGNLHSREQSRRRDAALAQFGADLLGPDLLGEGGRDAIDRRAWDTLAVICAATPGLCALGVVERRDRLEVDGYAGVLPGGTDVPAGLPLAILPDRPPPLGGSSPVADRAALPPGRWLVLPVPERPRSWLVIGTPRAVPTEALVAVSSLLTHTALAVRTSAAHRSLAVRAHTDPLSGLANRTAFFAALEARLVRPTPEHEPPCAVLFLDLDDFKTVNDGLGHAAGDELLRILGARITGVVRPTDLCARIGGDEFAVLLDDGAQGEEVAERIVRLISSPVQIAGRRAQVGVSIGLALATADTDVETLVQHADLAMYATEAQGKNRVRAFHATTGAPPAVPVDVSAPG